MHLDSIDWTPHCGLSSLLQQFVLMYCTFIINFVPLQSLLKPYLPNWSNRPDYYWPLNWNLSTQDGITILQKPLILIHSHLKQVMNYCNITFYLYIISRSTYYTYALVNVVHVLLILLFMCFSDYQGNSYWEIMYGLTTAMSYKCFLIG